MINVSTIGDRVRTVYPARSGDVIAVDRAARKSKVRWDTPPGARDSWRAWGRLILVRHVLDRAEVAEIFSDTLDI